MDNNKIILVATTSAANSSSFIKMKLDQDITILVPGLAGTEKAYLQVYSALIGDYIDLLYNGLAIFCSATNNVINIPWAGSYRIRKEATASAVGVEIFTLAF